MARNLDVRSTAEQNLYNLATGATNRDLNARSAAEQALYDLTKPVVEPAYQEPAPALNWIPLRPSDRFADYVQNPWTGEYYNMRDPRAYMEPDANPSMLSRFVDFVDRTLGNALADPWPVFDETPYVEELRQNPALMRVPVVNPAGLRTYPRSVYRDVDGSIGLEW